MKQYVGIVLMASLILLIGCNGKKDDDFRNVLIGQYKCYLHHCTSEISCDSIYDEHDFTSDRVIGEKILIVSKFKGDTVSLLIDNRLYNSVKYRDSLNVKYNPYVSFTNAGDSITVIYSCQWYEHDQVRVAYYLQGKKINRESMKTQNPA